MSDYYIAPRWKHFILKCNTLSQRNNRRIIITDYYAGQSCTGRRCRACQSGTRTSKEMGLSLVEEFQSCLLNKLETITLLRENREETECTWCVRMTLRKKIGYETSNISPGSIAFWEAQPEMHKIKGKRIADYLHQSVQIKETVYRFYFGTKYLSFSYIP